MPKVYLKDVVTRIKDKVDKDNTDLEFYIGGEHFDNGEIQITRRGVIAGSTIGPAFHMRFVPGDVLLMSRNPHLRKAGVVDFEGICSDVSYVCRTKDENILMQKFLPFIFQSDDFWKFAEENKKGSTNFFLNWSDFEKYEFTLPDIETQRKLVEMLWAFEDTKTAYKKLIEKTDELVKSQFIEMFGDPSANPMGWKKQSLESLSIKITDGVHKKPNYTNDGKPFISVTNINRGVIDFTDCKYVSEEDYQKMIKTTFPEKGDVLYTKVGATYGIPAYIDTAEPFGLYVSVCLIKPKHELIDARFLTESMRMDYVKKQADDRIKGIGVPDLHLKEIKEFWILCPPRQMQEQFVELVQQSDKSKFELKQAIADVDSLARALLQQELK